MKTLRSILLVFYALLFLTPVCLYIVSAVTAEDTALPVAEVSDSTEVTYMTDEESLIYEMEIEGVIGVVTQERILEAIEIAEDDDAELLVIRLNTPGGFSNATRSICSDILNSDVPVCVYVWPSGAHSGSAGVYIAYAANFAAMANTTNIGSAHPVAGGGADIDSIMNEKVTNDAVAQIKSYAEKRGRNVEWAEKAVRESVNITDKEALEMNVINYRARNIDELLDQINGDTTEVKSGLKICDIKDKRNVQVIRPTTIQTLRELITRPTIAFALLTIGGAGIMLELYSPGAILPGVVGVISILLAAYAFQFLPINYIGVLLLIVAAVLFIAEIKVISHGLLTVGGIVALFFGGLMLIDSVNPALQISLEFLIPFVLVVGILVGIVTYLVIKAHKETPAIGKRSMTGKIAKVKSDDLVYVDGALWQAESETPLVAGEKVEIVEQVGMVLKVKQITK